MSPLPLPWPSEVVVFLGLVFNPTTDSGATLGFFGGQSIFLEDFLLDDGCVVPVPLGLSFVAAFFATAYCLM